jgi:hypothetical protein
MTIQYHIGIHMSIERKRQIGYVPLAVLLEPSTSLLFRIDEFVDVAAV